MLATVGPASATVAPQHAGKYCATIVSKDLDARGLSKVLGTSCSAVSAEAAYRQAATAKGGVQTTASIVSLAASTLLLNEYTDAVYNGGVLYTFYGSSGTCDSTGYRLTNYSSVGDVTSSITGYNNCNRARIQGYYSTAEQIFTLNVSNLGSTYNDNDNVYIVRTYHA